MKVILELIHNNLHILINLIFCGTVIISLTKFRVTCLTFTTLNYSNHVKLYLSDLKLGITRHNAGQKLYDCEGTVVNIIDMQIQSIHYYLIQIIYHFVSFALLS